MPTVKKLQAASVQGRTQRAQLLFAVRGGGGGPRGCLAPREALLLLLAHDEIRALVKGLSRVALLHKVLAVEGLVHAELVVEVQHLEARASLRQLRLAAACPARDPAQQPARRQRDHKRAQ
jgi:hypothetical protein